MLVNRVSVYDWAIGTSMYTNKKPCKSLIFATNKYLNGNENKTDETPWSGETKGREIRMSLLNLKPLYPLLSKKRF